MKNYWFNLFSIFSTYLDYIKILSFTMDYFYFYKLFSFFTIGDSWNWKYQRNRLCFSLILLHGLLKNYWNNIFQYFQHIWIFRSYKNIQFLIRFGQAGFIFIKPLPQWLMNPMIVTNLQRRKNTFELSVV